MATQPQPPQKSRPDDDDDDKRQAPVAELDKKRNEERAARARQIFDENEKDDDDLPLTTQTDQLRRSMEMEEVGPSNWMNEQERRIRERQGEPPHEPRQVHGVAPPQKPR